MHARGLIHRDIKPANVILHDDGAPRLVDFGLAAHLGSDRLRELSGSPPYMAPEQARGEWDRIDFRTDVFGLGARALQAPDGPCAPRGVHRLTRSSSTRRRPMSRRPASSTRRSPPRSRPSA